MKKLLIFLLPLALVCSCGKVELSENDGKGNPNNPGEPDLKPEEDIFLQYCIGNYDTDGDGTVSQYEADQITSIDCADMGIVRLTDIGKFSNLETLDCSGNSLVSLDLSKNRHLVTVNCLRNSLKYLSVDGCKELRTLDCAYNALTALDLSSATDLQSVDCSNNSLATLDVGGCSSLQTLDCSYNSLTLLDLSRAASVVTVDCKRNSLTSLTLTGCSRLESLDCSYNSLTTLDVSQCPNLSSLNCTDNDSLAELTIYLDQIIESLNKASHTELRYDYKVGDIVYRNGAEGIVFYTADGGRHGKIVSTNETQCYWSTKYVPAGATDENDGMANMKKIQAISGWHEKYPAFAWCADKGEGWYLPAVNELKTLYESNVVELEDYWYWSSTEYDEWCAWDVYMYNGDAGNIDKLNGIYVRAVCAF